MLRFGIYIQLSQRSFQVCQTTYEFTQACQSWEQRGRCFSLLVYAVEDEHVLATAAQHTLHMRHQCADVLASSCELCSASIDSVFLQAVVYSSHCTLQQMSPCDALFATYGDMR